MRPIPPRDFGTNDRRRAEGVSVGGARRSALDGGSTVSTGRALAVVLGLASVAVLSVAIPAYLVADVPDVGRSNGWVVTLVIMVWGGVRLSLIWVSGVAHLFDFFFWVFTYIFMGLGPTVQMRSAELSTTTPGVDAGYDLPTAGLIVLGIACYECARLTMILVQMRRRPRDDGPRGVDGVRSGLLVGFGLVASAYYVVRIGPAGALGSREAAFAARNAAWPDPSVRALFYAAAVYPLLVAAGALAQVRKMAATRAAAVFATVGALGCGGLLLLIVNPIASARYTFGTVAVAMAIFWGAAATRRRSRLLMLGVIVGFLFVFPIADAFRRTEVRASRVSFFGEYLANPDYDAFWQVSNAIAYWADGLVEPGRQFLGSMFFWVPRAIWADKPTDTGILLANYRGYSFDNLSAPLWAEAVVNGGLIAVVLVFVALGLGLRAMDTRLPSAFAHGGVWAIVGAIFPVFMTILLRGSLLQATGAAMVSIAAIVFVAARVPPSAGSGDSRPEGLHAPSR